MAAAADVDPKIMDGKATAATIYTELTERVAALKEKTGLTVCLAALIVGDRSDSAMYVRMKKKAAANVGIESRVEELPADITQEDLIAVVQGLNDDDSVHGILVQLPLPAHIEEDVVLDAISLEKDVDGFHPLNIGHLALKGREPLATSCTPKGCMELLARYGVDCDGKNAVVVGRSNIVGMPMALLLNNANATVTICHSRTADLTQHLANADIVVAAIGRPDYIKGADLKEGCVVLDVGMNKVDDESRKSGYRWVGDVEFEAAKEKASLITPVPGGVGRMTVAMLLVNVVDAAERTTEGAS